EDGGLRGAVVRLIDVAAHANTRGCVDEPTVGLCTLTAARLPVPDGGAARQPAPADMHTHDVIEVLDRHGRDRAIAQDARIVDHDVDAPPQVDGALKQGLDVVLGTDVPVVGHG